MSSASGLGARIDASLLPIAPRAREWFVSRGQDPILAAIGASDDYELLLAVAPKAKGRLRAARATTATPFTQIGVLTRQPACILQHGDVDAPLPESFEHFVEA